jgi:chemotaxis protein CheX
MQLIEEEIRRLVPTVWDTILHLSLEPRQTAPKDNRGMVSACVHITGAWNGAIALSCDTDFAGQAASIMFDLAAVPPTTEEMQDALGELTNIVGGNVKALLPESCHLSLPAALIIPSACSAAASSCAYPFAAAIIR